MRDFRIPTVTTYLNSSRCAPLSPIERGNSKTSRTSPRSFRTKRSIHQTRVPTHVTHSKALLILCWLKLQLKNKQNQIFLKHSSMNLAKNKNWPIFHKIWKNNLKPPKIQETYQKTTHYRMTSLTQSKSVQQRQTQLGSRLMILLLIWRNCKTSCHSQEATYAPL